MVILLKFIAIVAAVFILINQTKICAQSSGGKLLEKMRKTRLKVLHMIELKASHQAQVTLLTILK